MTPTRTILQKADLSLADLIADGGYLEPAQAKKFLERAIKKAKLSGMITVTTLASPTQILENLRFAGQVLQPGTSGESLTAAQRSKPDLAKETWNAQLFKAEVRIPDEVLEDNIEGQGLKTTIMNRASEAVGRDAEKVVIQGNTASADPLLAQLDGITVQAASHVVSASGARLDKDELRKALRAMPKEYLDDRANLSYLTSINAADDYSDSLAVRATELGDINVVRDEMPKYKGIPVTDIPLFPETLGTGSDETVVLLTNPKNIYMGVWRKIKVATDMDVSAGVFIIVISLRFDVRFAIEDAVVKLTEVLNS
jgi:HK97 family phage major capsid protein